MLAVIVRTVGSSDEQICKFVSATKSPGREVRLVSARLSSVLTTFSLSSMPLRLASRKMRSFFDVATQAFHSFRCGFSERGSAKARTEAKAPVE
jgi:H2-forming N5,N10-methylenetetrahydromethanopterin dehydrogenase-like enzyme